MSVEDEMKRATPAAPHRKWFGTVRGPRRAGGRAALLAAGLALAANLALVGCQNAPPPPLRFPAISFAQFSPIRLDVSRVDVIDRYHAPDRPSHVEQEMPVNLARAAERWGHERLLAAGQNNSARVTIKTASVTMRALPTSSGFKSFFTTQQSEAYTARLDVVVEILDDHGFTRSLVEATAQRSTSLPENVTPNRRDADLYNLEDAVMTDLNAALEKNIRAFMGRYILS